MCIRDSRALGVQFHPEVDPALVEQWIGDGEEVAALGIDPADLRESTARLAGDAARRLRLLVRGFLAMLAHDADHGAGRLG